MFEAIRSWAVKILSKIMPSIFRWIYSHEKLVGLIDVTINSENDGVVINCSELPDARAWIEVTNLAPFKLKLVGVEAILYWVGRVAEFQSLQRIDVLPHTKLKLLIESSLNELQAAYIRKNHALDNPRLHIKLYFESSIRDIEKQRDMQTTNIKLLNCENA